MSPTPDRSRNLDTYKAKRAFDQTPEPAGEVEPGEGHLFVIHKHAARRLHYDLRLEMEGVLRSWAVPKGLSTEAGLKRAAFEVEDHPLNYMKFEGTIPKGQYGGGTVMVWDLGTYELLEGSKPGRDLKVRLKGRKLKGEWHLFRIRSEDGKPVWLVVKSKPSLKPISPRQDDRSVGRGMDPGRRAARHTLPITRFLVDEAQLRELGDDARHGAPIEPREGDDVRARARAGQVHLAQHRAEVVAPDRFGVGAGK